MQTTNQPQIEYWNGPAADRWVRNQERMDESLRVFGTAALDAVRPAAGERVLDVGCGCGDTTLSLAQRGCRPVGLDVSAPMLARAHARAPELPFVVADAALAPLAPGSFDAVVSRFGVMFFVDPPAAFRSLRALVRPGGRLGFVCWRSLGENSWAKVGYEAIADLAPPGPTDPDAPGPFALRDPARVRGILEGGGWSTVAVAPFDTIVSFSAGPDVEEAVTNYAELGPVARILASVDAAGRAVARERLTRVLAPHVGADGLRLEARAWVVSAVA